MQYEYSAAQSFGGAVGTYHTPSPWGGHCEVRVVAISAKAGAGVTLATLGNDTGLVDTNVATATNDNSPVAQLLLNFAANTTVALPDAWYPVTEKGCTALISGAAAWVSVQFRREPNTPEQPSYPATLPLHQQDDGYYWQQVASEAQETQKRG